MSRSQSFDDDIRNAMINLDAAAEGGPIRTPEVVVEAIAFSSAQFAFRFHELSGNFSETHTAQKLYIAICKKIHQVGYLNGVANTQAKLGVGQG